jgi:hypothetical protein
VLAVLKAGRDPKLAARAVAVPLPGRWLYHGYDEIDRDESARPTFKGMVAVLDEYGVEDREERLRWRRLWRRMYRAEAAVVKQIRDARDKRRKKRRGAAPDEAEE